jgi:hypothetical protein
MQDIPLCPECGRVMAYRLGGYECPGCGRMLLPSGLEPAAVEAAAAPAVPEAFIRAAAEHAANPGAPLLPQVEPEGSRITGPASAPVPARLPSAASQNTSGLGAQAVLPSEASGGTMASVLPLGLFSFCTGDLLWGFIGLVGTFVFIPGLVYWAYIGLEGKKRAWRCRRFASVEEFARVMRAWELASWIYLSVVGVAAIMTAYFFAKWAESWMQQNFGL